MKINKINLLIFMLTIVVMLLSSPKEIFRQSLIGLHIIKKCYKPSSDFIEIFKQENIDYKKEDQAMVEDGIRKLQDKELLQNRYTIPKVTHHIYFTSDSPKLLTPFFIEKLKATFNKLNNVESGWSHYIWTNKREIVPDEIIKIDGVKIKNISEFKGHTLYKYLADSIQKGNEIKAYFAEGSDLLRLMAVQKYGGIYNDMDYEIYNPEAMLGLLNKFDFIGGREITKSLSLYGNSFIAAKPNHPIINQSITLSLRNQRLNNNVPDYIKYPCNEFDRVYFNGPLLFTMSYFQKNNQDSNVDIILPTWMILNASFARYKNYKGCNYNEVTKDDFNKVESNLVNLLKEYPSIAKEEGVEDSNIYYSIKNRDKYDIIGADMFCGGWASDSKGIKRRNIYWGWQ